MKILLIGASGTVGSAVKAELAQRHEVISIGRTSGDFQVDISDSASIRRLFEQTGKFDALICAAGNVNFVALGDMSENDFELGLRDKLMGQVNLAASMLTTAPRSPSPVAFSTVIRFGLALLRHWSMAHSMRLSKRQRSNCHEACASTP